MNQVLHVTNAKLLHEIHNMEDYVHKGNLYSHQMR